MPKVLSTLVTCDHCKKRVEHEWIVLDVEYLTVLGEGGRHTFPRYFCNLKCLMLMYKDVILGERA